MDKERFSLLLLDPGEYYFEDHSAILKKKNGKNGETRVAGQLKICSKSVVFDAKDVSEPIVKIPFKDCVKISRYQDQKDQRQKLMDVKNTNDEILSFQCNAHILLLEGNTLAPYTFKNEKQTFLFQLKYAKVEQCLPQIGQLHRASTLPQAQQNQMVDSIAHARQCRLVFEPAWLEDLDEQIVMQAMGSKITPLVSNPGLIVLSNMNLYFQPFNNIEKRELLKVKLKDVKKIVKRRFALQQVGLEIYCRGSSGLSHLYLSLRTSSHRDDLHKALISQRTVSLDHDINDVITFHWQNGAISNYDYLLHINCLADRTFNDLTQYPVFPWIVRDYTSDQLDLTSEDTFRDLTKPIGALNGDRLEKLKERYEEMPPPKFLYGSHYSTPGFVLYYLVRKYPHFMLCLQNGRFDHPDRMFNSIADVWKNVLANMSDFKELIPEFYDVEEGCGDFLQNAYAVNFGHRHDGTKVGDVALPPWAKGPSDLVFKLREALESDYVSANLHHWIDLIFGYKQRGEEAFKANNEYYYLSYEGAVDLDSVTDWNRKHALQVQIMEFGQTPKQIFKRPHPARKLLAITDDTSLASNHSDNDDCSSLDSLTLFARLDAHKEEITGLAFSLNSRTVYSVSRDTHFKMHSTDGSGQLARRVSLSKVALSCLTLINCDRIAVVGCLDSKLVAYDIECGRILDTVCAHEDAITCIAWCDVTTRLVSGSWDCSVRIWQASLPWQPIKAHSAMITTFQHDSRVLCLAISYDEKLLASGTESGVINVWSLDSYNVLHVLTVSGAITGVQFGKTAERLICCSRSGQFCVFDLTSETCVYAQRFEQSLTCLCWKDTQVYIGGTNGALFFWDLSKNTAQKLECGSNGTILSVSCSPCTRIVAAGGKDRKIYIWKR